MLEDKPLRQNIPAPLGIQYPINVISAPALFYPLSFPSQQEQERKQKQWEVLAEKRAMVFSAQKKNKEEI